MEFLIGSPFTTPVGQRIERATSSGLQTEDWALNMEICDLINETGDGPKDAVRALKKRIVGNRNFREVMLALTVLEACVKNCGERFHVLVSTREFVEGVLVRTILPKNNPPLVLHDRVLSIIQAWADAFRSSPALTGVVSVYEDLRRKGLDFPSLDLDGSSPIHTPHRTVPDRGSAAMPVPAPPLSPASPPPPAATPTRTENHASAPPCQVKKLKEDLVVVRGNLTVMSDMMNQLEPASANHTERELLQQLYGVCEGVQVRLVELVPRLSDEVLIEELLSANDLINSTFTRYHRLERKMSNGQNTKQQSPTYINLTDLDSAAAKPLDQSQPGSKPDDQSELAATPAQRHLSQSAVDSLSSQMTRLTTEAGGVEPSTRRQQRSEGLTVAQSSTLHNAGPDDSPDPALLGSSPQFDWMVERGMIPVSQTTVMDDIERWLDVEVDGDEEEQEDSEGVTSEEFDRFLAERAKAADRLPSRTASSNTSQSQP